MLKLIKKEKYSFPHPQAQNTVKSTEFNLVYSPKKKKKRKKYENKTKQKKRAGLIASSK